MDDYLAECEKVRGRGYWKSVTSTIDDLVLQGFARAANVRIRVIRDDGLVTVIGSDECSRVVSVGYLARPPGALLCPCSCYGVWSQGERAE